MAAGMKGGSRSSRGVMTSADKNNMQAPITVKDIDSNLPNLGWLAITMLVILISMGVSFTFFTVTELKQSVEGEMQNVQESLGNDSWEFIEARTKELYRNHFYENGIYDFVEQSLLSKGGFENEESKALATSLILKTRIYAYQFFLRFTVVEYTVFVLLPVLICIVMTGYYKWRIKRHQLGGSSAGRSRVILKVFSWVALVFSFVMISPSMIVGGSAYVPGLIMLTTALMISLYVSNFSKDF